MMFTNQSRFATASEVRIHAHVCGDGHLYTEKGERGTRYVIEYTNKNRILIEEFVSDAKHAYNASPTVIWRKNKYSYIARFKSRYAFHRLTSLGAGSSKNWRINIKTLSDNELLVTNWLRAFFDDEAYVDTSTKRIVVTSVNLRGLKDVSTLLEFIGIKPCIYEIIHGKAYRLVISKKQNLLKYAEKVGFKVRAKSMKLSSIL